jgi:hypothetical protein
MAESSDDDDDDDDDDHDDGEVLRDWNGALPRVSSRCRCQ